MRGVLVSHTHWDREWYRTFQSFRARLVDTVDRVLDLLALDPGWKFHLDGQTIVLEDYLAIRPSRRADLEEAIGSGRLGVGPWYVQPDSLLPSGETHIRNLLEGRRVGEQFGPVSRVAYTPDSFGHPGTFPLLFAGFGLGPFVYWRGNGSELDRLPPIYRWDSPDGTSVTACHLGKGYFAAAHLPDDVDAAVERLTKLGHELSPDGDGPVLFMNGVDHALPDAHTDTVVRALVSATHWDIERGVMDDFAALVREPEASFAGELIGGRTANLLPGVWSSRLGQKLRNRAAETALCAWAEPWVALGRALGLTDEQPSLRVAWRALLANQAHDSIGGCSQDPVHDQMEPRFAEARELAEQTTRRVLERLTGLGEERRLEWQEELDVAVFNPTPAPVTGLVRFPVEGYPVFDIRGDTEDIHPLSIVSLLRKGYTVDGTPGRLVIDEDPGRFRVIPEQMPWTLEYVATVPAFGWTRFRLAPSDASPDDVDDGRSIGADGLAAEVSDDGTLNVTVRGQTWSGLLAVEDVGDRGDTYDFDPVGTPEVLAPVDVVVERRRHAATGIEVLRVARTFDVPRSLAADRKHRAPEVAVVSVIYVATVAPGVEHIDVEVTVDNTASDHRLRLLFPTGGSGAGARAATTLGVVDRSPAPADDDRWLHPAPTTFPQQGWVACGGLTVGAPGLPEAEVGEDGTIAITLVRAVGWLARLDLVSRPEPAGPGMPAPNAQCLGLTKARLSLSWGEAPWVEAGRAEAGLVAVGAGSKPKLREGTSLLTVSPSWMVLSAVKPSEAGRSVVVRLMNPTDDDVVAEVVAGFPFRSVVSVRLDEQPDQGPLEQDGDRVTVPVSRHGVRTMLFVGGEGP